MQKKRLISFMTALWNPVFCVCLCMYVLTQVQTPPVLNQEGYLERSQQSLSDPAFFFSARAFTTTLIYKVCGSNPERIVRFQKIFLVASWTLLSTTLGMLVASPFLRFLSWCVFPCMALWWNILGWSSLLLSEACSFSFFAVWLSALIVFLKKPSRLTLLVSIVVGVLFSFSKDNLPYFLLIATVLLLVSVRVCIKPFFERYSPLLKSLLFAMLLLFLVQNVSAQIGQRQQFCLVNVLLQRIFPNPEYSAWFIDRGMPVESDILKYRGQWASLENFRLFNDMQYESFMKWVLYRGTSVYAIFLVTHPDYTFRPFVKLLPVLFSYNLNLFVGLPPDIFCFRLLYAILPATSILASIALALVSFAAAIIRKRAVYVVPMVLLISLWANALFIYHADAMDVPRHCLMNMIGLECLSYMAFLLIADSVVCQKKSDCSVLFHDER
jgi:hypothetical protein